MGGGGGGRRSGMKEETEGGGGVDWGNVKREGGTRIYRIEIFTSIFNAEAALGDAS